MFAKHYLHDFTKLQYYGENLFNFEMLENYKGGFLSS